MTDPADPHILGPGLLPTPFSADEIRAGCPAGRTIRIRIERDGEVVGWRVNRWGEGDDEGATLHSQRFDAHGEPLAEPDVSRVTWADLQGHASFEAARTVRQPAVIDSPMGQLQGLHYQRTEDDGSISDFWFASSMPGMPIRYRSVVDGRVTNETFVVENRLPGAVGSGA